MNNWKEINANGRVCILGEHSDWAAEFGMYKGRALAFPTDLVIKAKARKSKNFIISEGREKREFLFEEVKKIAEDIASYYRFCCAVVYYMIKEYNIVTSVELNVYYRNLPMRSGFSSSAAISVLLVKAYNEVYDLALDEKKIMEIAYKSELITGSKCGRLDQIGVLPPKLYDVTFEKNSPPVISECVIESDWFFFGVILSNNKNTADILSDLQKSYTINRNMISYLGYYQEKIVDIAIRAFETSDFHTLGELLKFSQDEFDNIMLPISKINLAGERYHKLVKDALLRNNALGYKEIGSHGDGTALFLCEDLKRQKLCMNYIEEQYGYKCVQLILRAGGIVE